MCITFIKNIVKGWKTGKEMIILVLRLIKSRIVCHVLNLTWDALLLHFLQLRAYQTSGILGEQELFCLDSSIESAITVRDNAGW